MNSRRIKLKEEKLGEWKLIPYVFTDASGVVIGYNFQCVKQTKRGFIEFVRLDLHKKGRPEEDAPHIHLRIESKEMEAYEEAKSIIGGMISNVVPKIRVIVK